MQRTTPMMTWYLMIVNKRMKTMYSWHGCCLPLINLKKKKPKNLMPMMMKVLFQKTKDNVYKADDRCIGTRKDVLSI